jgi:YD repeat-containing protein
MRRKHLLLLLILIIAIVAHGQQKKNDLEQAGLKGKVKTIKVDSAKISNKTGQPVEGKKVTIETTNYGENGMLVKSVRVDRGERGDYFYSYDASGNRLELIRNSTASSRVKTEFKYDASGNRTEENQTGEAGPVGKVEYFYDAKGNCVEKKLYNKQALFARRIYAYGADGNPSEEVEYDTKGSIVGKQSYTYELDSTGNWTKRMTSAQGMSNGKQIVEPAEVTYRTITYY